MCQTQARRLPRQPSLEHFVDIFNYFKLQFGRFLAIPQTVRGRPGCMTYTFGAQLNAAFFTSLFLSEKCGGGDCDASLADFARRIRDRLMWTILEWSLGG